MLKAIAKQFVPPSIWTQLRLMRMQWGITSYSQRTAHHRFGSCELEVLLADPEGAGWYDHDWQDLPELALLKQGRLKPGARVFDIGAHQCVVALMLAKAVGQDGFVLALEPNPHNVAVGEQNKKLNRAECVHIVHGAVAESSGMIVMSKALNAQVDDGSHEWGSMKVASFSIDDLSERYGPPDVLFVDVEGYECRALAGATETLKSRPDCFVEVHLGAGLEKFGTVSELLSFFPHRDYSLFVRTERQSCFINFSVGSVPPQERFFLVALHR